MADSRTLPEILCSKSTWREGIPQRDVLLSLINDAKCSGKSYCYVDGYLSLPSCQLLGMLGYESHYGNWPTENRTLVAWGPNGIFEVLENEFSSKKSEMAAC